MFASKERIPVTVDDSGNRIWIRKGLTVRIQAAVQDASVSVHIDQQNTSKGEVLVGGFKRALLQAYVVGWDGPAFAGVKCTPANIDELDAQDPLVDATAQKAAELYTQATRTDPKGTQPQVIDGISFSLDAAEPSQGTPTAS